MLTESQKQELQAKQLHQTLADKGFIDEEVSYQLDYWHTVFTEINSRYEKVINTSKQLREIILEAQQERTKILNEKKELKQQIKKLKEEKEKSLYEINDLESDLDISNEIIVNKNGTIKGLVDKSNKQNQTINKLQDYQSYLAKKKKKTMKQCQQRVDNLKAKIKNKDQIINKKQDIITNAENYLGVNSLSSLPTLPTGKTLTDLITFYNNPPTCSHSAPQPIIITKTKEIPVEIIKEVEKPVIKIQEIVKEVESEAQKKEIERLEGIVKDLRNTKKELIVVYKSDKGKIITIYSLVGVIIVLGVAFAYLLRRKRKL